MADSVTNTGLNLRSSAVKKTLELPLNVHLTNQNGRKSINSSKMKEKGEKLDQKVLSRDDPTV